MYVCRSCGRFPDAFRHSATPGIGMLTHCSAFASLPSLAACSETADARRTDTAGSDTESGVRSEINRPLRFLLLSDDDRFCALVRSCLEHLGFGVFRCTAVRSAEVLLLEKKSVDLWLIDVQSLGVQAMCFAIKVRKSDPKAPMILISEVRRDASGFQRLFCRNCIRIAKPVAVPDLLATIHRALSSASLEAESNASVGSSYEGWFYDDWIQHLIALRSRVSVLN
jgi:DNA-binding NtrC family response regulator